MQGTRRLVLRLELLENLIYHPRNILKIWPLPLSVPLQVHRNPRHTLLVLTSSPSTRHIRHPTRTKVWLSRHTRQHRPLSSQASNHHCRFAETAPFPILNHHHSHPARLSSKSRHSTHTPTPAPQDHHQIIATPFNSHRRPTYPLRPNSNSTANPPPNLKHNHLEPIISLSPPTTTDNSTNPQPPTGPRVHHRHHVRSLRARAPKQRAPRRALVKGVCAARRDD